jgi:ATP-dependent helicase/nuclease subunit A
MKALIDAGARERIETDLDVSMCVEAGAGTGKTTMLIKRIVALLRAGRATIDQLAVITFTEKAAAELSARLRFELEFAVEAAVGDDERARLETALLALHRARVQTIHAFAGDLLRERPVEAGIDPRFTVLEDLAASLDFDAAYRSWLDELLASSRQEVEVAMRRGFELRHLRQVAEIVHQHRHVLPLAASAPEVPDVAGYRAWAAWASGELDECGPTCTDVEDKAFVALAPVQEYLALIERADDAEVERLVLFESPRPHTTAGSKDNWSPETNCGRVKDIYGEIRSGRTPALINALRTEALCNMLIHVERFVLAYADQRRKEGNANFEDLLIRSRDLVRDNPLVREHFRRRSTHVLVDEFQDTDPIQAELIAWISAPPGAEGDWRKVVPEPGSLFVVGDPKQSIYRFRGADIAAYDAVKRGPLANRLERLEQNFRSTESVLGWVNELFDRVFVEQPGVQPANTHLVARDTTIDDKLDRSAIVVVHSLGEWAKTDKSTEAMRAEESSLLARTLWRAVEEERWPVRDRRADDAVRPARWRDVAILLPSRTRVELLEAALQRHGVPYRLEGGRGFYARQEVRDLISLLEAIDDPADSIAIVAALRSLAFGCSDDDLLLWRVANERFDYRWIGNDGPASVRESLEVMADLHRAQRSFSLGDLVRMAVERSGLVEAALTVPGGDQAAANVLKVVDVAQEFAGAGGGALRGFTNWLTRNRDEEEREDDAPVAEERDDIVRIMTIHAAKGLEFPIVALANVEWGGSKQAPPIPDALNHRINLTVGNDWARFQTPNWDAAKQSEKDALEAERDRLLYVAVTRARDHVVVPVCTAPDAVAKGFMAKMSESVGGVDPERWGEDIGGCWQYDTRTLDTVAERPPDVVTVDSDEPADSGAVAERGRLLAERDVSVRAASQGIELVTASGVKSSVRPLVAEADAADDASDEAPAGIETEAAPPLELGDAFHRVMELVDLPEAETLEPLVEAICEEHGIPDSAEAVVAMARLAMTALEREGLPAEGMHREVPFVVPDGNRVLIGRIDVLSTARKRVDVIDFKTDERIGEPLAVAVSRHRGQLETYETAVSLVADCGPILVGAVFVRTGELALFSTVPSPASSEHDISI